MPRPRKPDDEVSPAALRMRKMRERNMEQHHEASGIERSFLSDGPGMAPEPFTENWLMETAHLVRVTLWVPKGDEKAIEFAAQRLRKAARISEDEVPE